MASKRSKDESLMRIKRSTYTLQFEINYSKSKDLPIRKHISSPIFSAGGYDWYLTYYPRGIKPENMGLYISLYLNLESEVNDEKILVECSFAILDNENKFFALSNDMLTTFTSNNTSWGYERILAKDRIEQFYCRNGMVVASLTFRVLTKPKVVKNSGGLCNHIEKLWEKGQRFDVTFEVEGERIPAHRFMLAARSPVFETELYGPMAEAKMEHIKINEMKPEVFKSLLHFIYTDKLPNDGSGDNIQSVELLQGLLVAADRYWLDKLTLLCEKQLEKKLSVDTVMTTLSSADRHGRRRLKQKCLEFASDPKNFSQVVLTDGYLNVLYGAPSLFAELKKEVNGSSHSAKIQRTS